MSSAATEASLAEQKQQTAAAQTEIAWMEATRLAATKAYQATAEAAVVQATAAMATQSSLATADADQERATSSAATLTAIPTPTSALIPPATAKKGDTWTSPIDGMLMAYIPAGEFEMGSEAGDDNEKPVHTVSLDGFWMYVTEVTNALFEQFVNATGYQTAAGKEGNGWVFDLQAKEWKDTSGADWRHPQGQDSSIDFSTDHPVVQVSWQDAKAYCEWVGGRLPTEAEWEKAARADRWSAPTHGGEQAPNGELVNFADRSLEVFGRIKT